MGFPPPVANGAGALPAHSPTVADQREPGIAAAGAFAVAAGAIAAAGAGFIASPGRGRLIELFVLGGAAIAAYALGSRAGLVGAAITGGGFLALETYFGRLDGDHVGSQIPLAVAFVLAPAASAVLRDSFDAWNVGRETDAGDRPPFPAEGPRAGAQAGTLEFALVQALRTEARFSLLVARPDSVDAIVRRHGPQIGRGVLDTVAQVLRAHLRSSDILIRQGLYDFWVILPGVAPETARVTGERIRLALAEDAISVDPGKLVRPSLSVGVAASPADGTSNAALVDAGMRALAAASALGGNRTVLHSAPPGAPRGWALEHETATARESA